MMGELQVYQEADGIMLSSTGTHPAVFSMP
jgi:hypothetical protein